MSSHLWILPLALFWFFGFSHWRGGANKARAKWALKSREKQARGDWELNEGIEPDFPAQQEMENQRRTIEDMEIRIAELENRLDFAERLLAGRSEAASHTQP